MVYRFLPEAYSGTYAGREGQMWGYSKTTERAFIMMMAYMLHDLPIVMLTAKGADSSALLLHHVMAIVSPLTMILYRGGGAYFQLMAAFFEFSNPFVNLHYMLALAGMSGSVWVSINGLIMTVVFAACRMPYLVWTWWWLYTNGAWLLSTSPLPVSAMIIAVLSLMTVVNLMWMYKMVRGCVKGIRKLRRKQD